MNTLPTSFFHVLLALSPILMVLYLMVGRNWGGSKAGPMGWLTAVFTSLIFFGTNGELLLIAIGKSLLLSLFVLYLIWMALLFYHTVNEAGIIATIGQEMPRMAHDKPAQALLLAWIFGSFLQGATGFGVPAAVVAPLLVGLGFEASIAVVVALLGHAWAVTFGSLGSSYLSLMAATGLPGELLATPTAVLLGVAALGCGTAVLWLTGGKTAVRQRGLFMLLIGLFMGGVQWALAVAGLWTLAAFGAGLAGLIVAIAYFSWESRGESLFDGRKLATAFIPYMILIVVILLGQLLFKEPLNRLQLTIAFPAVTTGFGWETAAENGRRISIFGHAGALLLYTSLITFAWYKWKGTAYYSGKTIAYKTLKGSIKPTIGIVTLVAMALTMQHAGMTQLLAETLSKTAVLFPILAPFIGALGAFMTGSNTNSNVVFGGLQMETAVALGLSTTWILAAQTAGGAIGSAFAPAKVIVGSSTVEGAEDGRVLKLTAVYGLAIIAVIGLITWLIV